VLGGIRYFADYELLEEIGRGGMGVVYKARQLSLDRIVAVKMILAGRFAKPEDVERFRAEAKAAAKLQHPGIVAIHEVGEHEGQEYYSMDYVQGQCLADLNGPLHANRAALYLQSIAQAVQYSHAHGVLHRDLKPSNILIDLGDHPRVTDFGLAKRLADNSTFDIRHSSLTLSGQVLGSPNFMPPEQAAGRGAKVGPYSDVYSLGAILYHLLTDRPPFVAETVAETLLQVATVDPLAPRVLNPSVPRDLETICLKCLEKPPAKRYPTAQSLADELGRFLRCEPISARPVSTAEKAWRWCRRQPALAGLGTAVILLLITVATVSTVAALRIAAARSQEATQHQLAEQQRLRAEERALAARQNEYAADMSLAQQALSDHNLGRALELLEKYRPRAKSEIRNPKSEMDLLGWEWRYLWQQSRSDELFTLHRGLSPHSVVVAVSPDGSRVAAASIENSVRLWNLHSQRPLAALELTNVSELAFSADGRWLACLSRRKWIKLVDGWTLQSVATVDHAALACAFAADSQSLYTADPTQVRRWRVPDGQEIERKSFELNTNAITSRAGNEQMAVAPDGGAVAWGSLDGGIRVWTLTNDTLYAAFPREGQTLLFRLSFSPDGQTLAAGYTDGSVRLWSLPDRRLLHTLQGHTAFVSVLAFSADGKRLATASYDQTIALWNTITGMQITYLMGHRDEVIALAFCPGGQRLISSSRDGSIRVWDARAKMRSASAQSFPFLAPGCALSPDGRTALMSSFENKLHLWDTLALCELPWQPATHSGSAWAAVASGGKMLATGTSDGMVHLWNCEGDRWVEMATFSGHTGAVHGVAFSPDGQFLASKGTDLQIAVWYLATRREVLRFDTGSRGGPLAFSPDSHILAAGSAGGATGLWDLRHRRSLAQLAKHPRGVFGVALSHDGRLAATASYDHTVKLWDIAAAPQVREVATLTGSLTPAWSVAFSPDDTRLAVGLGDGEVRLWNVQTHHEALRLKGHKLPVFAVQFTPDGHHLVSLSGDSLHIWTAVPLEDIDRSARSAAH
jgi:WD40 repeat protein